MNRSFLLETVRYLSRYDKYIIADFLLTWCHAINYWFNCYDKMRRFLTTAPNFGTGEKAITLNASTIRYKCSCYSLTNGR